MGLLRTLKDTALSHTSPKEKIYLTGPEREQAVHHREGNHSKKVSEVPHQCIIIAETEVLLGCAVLPAYRGKIKNRATMEDPSDTESLGDEHLSSATIYSAI